MLAITCVKYPTVDLLTGVGINVLKNNPNLSQTDTEDYIWQAEQLTFCLFKLRK